MSYTDPGDETPMSDTDAMWFGVLSVDTGNFIAWERDRDDAERIVQRLRELNPDMPADFVEVVEFAK